MLYTVYNTDCWYFVIVSLFGLVFTLFIAFIVSYVYIGCIQIIIIIIARPKRYLYWVLSVASSCAPIMQKIRQNLFNFMENIMRLYIKKLKASCNFMQHYAQQNVAKSKQ